MNRRLLERLRGFWVLGLGVMAILMVASCGDDTPPPNACTTDDECEDGFICVNGFCVIGGDAGDGSVDGGTDILGDRDGRGDGPDMTPDIPVIEDPDQSVEPEDFEFQTDFEFQQDVEQTDIEVPEDVEPDADEADLDDASMVDVDDDVPFADIEEVGVADIMEAEVDGPAVGDDADSGECEEPEVVITEGPSRVYANMVETAIIDGDPVGITSNIFVNEFEDINEVQVMVRIEHIDVEDLVVTLTNPDGDTVVTLHDRTTNEYGEVFGIYSWYDDEGLRAKPATPLSAFDGQDINGLWTLSIIDDTPGSEPCDCNSDPLDCDEGCNCDPDCGFNGRLLQWEIEFGPSTPYQVGGEDNDPQFTWEGLCADRYWYDSDAMPDTGNAGSPLTSDFWLGNHELNVLHTFFVIGGDGTMVSTPASRTFQFTDVW